MPIFPSSPFDSDVEKVTSETSTSENWQLILDLCDKVVSTPNGPKDVLKSIEKRLRNKNPHVISHTLTLLGALVNNAGKPFHLEVCSRQFCQEIRALLDKRLKQLQPCLQQKLLGLIQEWAVEFEKDPQLKIIPNLYKQLLTEYQFPDPPASLVGGPAGSTKIDSTMSTKSYGTSNEDEDIKKAIELSLQESSKKQQVTGQSAIVKALTAPSLYGSLSSESTVSKDVKKVRALYDFEAAEDNELTFTAGEIIIVNDDRDANWWKGENHRGTGLFPANFVTSDLEKSITPESPGTTTSSSSGTTTSSTTSSKTTKTLKFDEDVALVQYPAPEPEEPAINEDHILRALDFLRSADPTGVETPDPPDMLALEANCYRMGPLIDQELEKIDREHLQLTDVNKKLTDAFGLYFKLMKEGPSYGSQPQMAPVGYGIQPAGSMMGPSSYQPNLHMASQNSHSDLSQPLSMPPPMMPPGGGTGVTVPQLAPMYTIHPQHQGQYPGAVDSMNFHNYPSTISGPLPQAPYAGAQHMPGPDLAAAAPSVGVPYHTAAYSA